MSLYKISSIQRNRILQKEASFLLTTAAGHIAQNVAADVAIHKGMFGKGVVKSLSPETKNLSKFQKGKNYIAEGIKGFVMPESPISEEHVREIHDKIRNYHYKAKVLATHAAEGDWNKLIKTEEGRKALKEHLKTISEKVAKAVDDMTPKQISNMAEVYKNHPMGKNMIYIAKGLKGIDKVNHKKENFIEAGLNTVVGTFEPGIAILNSGKRVLGSTDVSKPIEKLQTKINDMFFTQPMEKNTEEIAENEGKISKKHKIINTILKYGGNAITAHMQDLGAKMMEAGMKDMSPEAKQTTSNKIKDIIEKKKILKSWYKRYNTIRKENNK